MLKKAEDVIASLPSQSGGSKATKQSPYISAGEIALLPEAALSIAKGSPPLRNQNCSRSKGEQFCSAGAGSQ